MTAPHTSWDAVPLMLRIEDLARVMNLGVRTIERWITGPEAWRLPVAEPRHGRRQPWTWRKAAVQQFMERGGAAAQRPRPRRLAG